MCPASVLLDGELSDKAVRAYGLLALRAFGRSKVALSHSELAAGLPLFRARGDAGDV
jgi:hypothetical protein